MGYFERIIGSISEKKKNRIIGDFLGIICQSLDVVVFTAGRRWWYSPDHSLS